MHGPATTQWDDDGAPVVWEGTLPALTRLTGGEETTFAWDQRDGSDVKVPPTRTSRTW